MTQLEIQVLSGLHSGARFTCSRAGFSLGGDHADLRLLDEEFEDVLLEFSQLESGALSVAGPRESYVIVDENGRSLGAETRWSLGQFLRVGDFWFALQERGSMAAIHPQLIDDDEGANVSLGDVVVERMASAEKAASSDASLQHAVPPEFFSQQQGRDYLRLRRKAAAGLVGGVSAILVIGLGFAGMPSEAHTNANDAKKLDTRPAVVVPPQPVQLVAPEPKEPPERAVKEFVRTLLQEHGLQEQVSFKVKDNEIRLSGSLPKRDVRDLDSLLVQIENRFGQDFKIVGKVETVSSSPNFRIREVVMGKDGWIVTDTGRRVLVGGEIGGFRVASITSSKVVLVGPERIEIDL